MSHKKKKGGGSKPMNGSGVARETRREPAEPRLHPDTKKSVWAVSFICVAIILILAKFSAAGPAGDLIHRGLDVLLGGWGYFILPATLLFAAAVFLFSKARRLVGMTLIGAGLLVLSSLALINIFTPDNKGGWLGMILGSLHIPFGANAAAIINIFILVIAILVTANVPLRLPKGKEDDEEEENEEEQETRDKRQELESVSVSDRSNEEPQNGKAADAQSKKKEDNITVVEPSMKAGGVKAKAPSFANYVPPPLSLLNSDTSKPTTGDLLANANIIKRTLESFGIAVEMGEINVGPAVTRYTLKPAEGVKLSRITTLNPDLAMSLAAHPIRIEAPIPGKSLVGIEVPNKAAALVRIGSMMHYPEFEKSGLLGFILGRDVSGEPVYSSIEKMPHMLVAGATGSGKSIFVHSLITSLLYKNSPQTLKLILIDPKRVELSVYEGIPHLVSPVVTENKKAAGVFRWAISEMERRYEVLQKAGSRDVKSYNSSHTAEDVLPYIVIIVDELADLMASFGREVEGSIVRLAQMARATGIHLVLATQRPSVEVITGLIKANITARVAMQVASQIDSRTIIDTPGAEKLLGHGDLLFLSAELSKPRRIQGSFITEEEIKSVAGFIRKHNSGIIAETPPAPNFEVAGAANGATPSNIAVPNGIPAPVGLHSGGPQNFEDFMNNDGANGDDDDMLDEAIATVMEAKKASASLLQRRLKVGYARAARLLDLMEQQGLIGPGDGAKPRDVYEEKIEERLS
jgi:S-DNA-T family DNA segregation ATPase FtsK/SpoIIIE